MSSENQTHDQKEQDQKRSKPQAPKQGLHEVEAPGGAFAEPAAALQRAISTPPPAVNPNDILALQRSAGNQAVQHLVAQRQATNASSPGLAIQPKLTVNPPGDRYEQEADRMASAVMGQIGSSQGACVQRQEEEEELQMKPANSIQRASAEEVPGVDPQTENRINAAKGSGDTLPESVRGQMEQGFGTDFSGVKIHTDSGADGLNQSLQARAFTTGQDIFFKSGEYSPDSSSGQQLLAHELTHVVQQNSGAMKRKENHNSDETVQRAVALDKMDPPGPNATGALDPGDFGITDTESVEPTTLTASQTGRWPHRRWEAVPANLTGKYSLVAQLPGANVEVTGPGGNTAEANYMDQAEELHDLGYSDGSWYMLQAVQDHEEVHEEKLEPALVAKEAEILEEFEKISVPRTRSINTADKAAEAIKASADYATAKADSRTIWDGEYSTRITGDHNALTPAAEHAVVDPMIEDINTWAGEQEPPLPEYAP